MLHHVSLGTNDLERAKAFYAGRWNISGFGSSRKSERVLGYGPTEFIFSLERFIDGKPALPGTGCHVAFHAGDRNTVDACHKAGLQNGGINDGPPDIRAQYDPHYYATFLRAPDGNKIETSVAVSSAGMARNTGEPTLMQTGSMRALRPLLWLGGISPERTS
jgi:catechol 2,3-dioxygenase-like lactoylglutathione lyase family enzyme